MRYVFIAAEKDNHSVRRLCKAMQVATSGYYAWASRSPSQRQKRTAHLRGLVRKVFEESGGIYGSPRVHAELKNLGEAVSRSTVEKLMHADGLTPPRKRRFVRTTQSNHDLPIAANLLERDFTAASVNEKWASDITYIPTDQGWLYLAVILDLFSRRVVGWSMGPRMPSQLVVDALEMAVHGRGGVATTLFHSDRGSQYASEAFRQRLKAFGLKPSMSRAGDCWDNAVVESFFGSLKQERVHRRRYRTRDEAKRDIFEYIEIFYNRCRLHSTLDYKSPVDYEMSAA